MTTTQKPTGGEYLTFLFLLLPVALLNGLVISRLWAWFVVAPFHQTPLGAAQCAGLSLALNYVRDRDRHIKTTSKPPLESLGQSVVLALFTWGFGWVLNMVQTWPR